MEIKKIEKWTHRKSGQLVVAKTKHIYWETEDGKIFRTKKLAQEYVSKLEKEKGEE